MAARKLVVYNDMRKDLAVFEEEYGSIVIDCADTKGMKSAKDCRKEIRDARSNLEDLRKEAKAPVLAKGTQIDDEAKDIKASLDTLYARFDGAIKAIENKKELAAKQAALEATEKENELEAREAAIIAKEIELGLREPEEDAPTSDEEGDGDDAGDDVTADTADGTGGGDVPSSDSASDNSSGSVATNTVSQCAETDSRVSTICEPHIKVAAERLHVLKKIRSIVEPTDAQVDGDMSEVIAANHDAALAEIWELVDVFQ